MERTDKELFDSEGRFLLNESDLVHKNNIEVNPLVPRTLVKQIDGKVGNWKTTYDIINEAPFRAEPLSKYKRLDWFLQGVAFMKILYINPI